MPSCARTEKNPVRRQICPFGSRLRLSEISHCQACYRISSKTTGGILFLQFGQNVPLNVLLYKYQKQIRSVEKHGRRRPSLIFLVIASPQKLLGGLE